MSKSKQLFEETRILVDTDEETRNYFIRIWNDYIKIDQSPKQLADSVQDNFLIKCSESDVVKAFALDIEEDDTRFLMKALNMYQ